MGEFRCNGSQNPRDRDMICIDTYRVLDSCRDKDCFEDVRVYLTCTGQEIINRTGAVRAKCANVVWSCIDIDNVPFNRGFYQLFIKIYVRLLFEACLGQGKSQEFEGVAVVEKKVILFGGEGNVSVFKSEFPDNITPCAQNCTKPANSLPIAVLETVDPIILNTKIKEPCKPCKCCPCSIDEIPDCVCHRLSSDLRDDRDSNILTVSLGFFSVVRIERSAQYLINAVEYSVPEKECTLPSVEDPCCLFRQMEFPTSEFSLPCYNSPENGEKKCGCSGS